MKDNVIPMAKTMQWHPMLPDIIGGDIAHRYMSINKTEGQYYSRSKKGLSRIKAPDTLDAIFDFYEKVNGSQIKSLLDVGFEIIVDFQRQRLTLSNSGCSIIDSANNTPFMWSMDRNSYFESKASTFFALHWLKNNMANEDAFDLAVGGDVEPNCKVKSEKYTSNVLNFNQWREKIAGLS